MFPCGRSSCGSSALASVLLAGLVGGLVQAGLVAAASDVFDNQLGDINYCKNQCQMTVRSKRPAKEGIMAACYRGCRLYSICQFVNGNAGFNTSRGECQGACQEAYRKLLEQQACSVGCASQPSEPEIQRRKLKALALRPHPPSIMDAISSWCSDLLSSAHSFMSSSWTFYLQADDGNMLVFQSQPEVDHTLPEPQGPRSNMRETRLPAPPGPLTQRPRGLRGQAEKAADRAAGRQTAQHSDPPEHDLLGCMSRRSGLPRWILAVCLFLSIMVMVWLSCASLVTAPEQQVRSQLSINGDKEFLDDVRKVGPSHLTSVIAMAVDQSEEEVGPLPVKVDLNKTAL